MSLNILKVCLDSFYFVYIGDSMLYFQHHYCSDPSEIILILSFPAQETFIIIINATIVLLIRFWSRSLKELCLFEISIFCSNETAFSVTSGQVRNKA